MGRGINFVRETPLNLDEILVHLGQFGKYQARVYILTSFPVIFSAIFALTYVFTAAHVPHRCHIPECDVDWHTYNPWWLSHAVPFQDNSDSSLPSMCLRYQPRKPGKYNEECPAELFTNTTKKCHHWVFQGPEKTITNEWNFTCEENKWKLALVGTVNNVGQFMGFPLAGFFSDKIGRKKTLIITVLMSGMMGILRSFSPSFIMFLIFEFLDATFAVGIYSTGFVLSIELVGAQKRVLGGTIISCFYAVGETVLGLTAYWLRSWRVMLRFLYAPTLLAVSYFWLIPESVRWLISQNRLDEARAILLKVAKTNGVTLDADILSHLRVEEEEERKVVEEEYVPTKETFASIFKSKILVWRVVNCAFCWLTNTFVFFGLALNSVSVGGNMYVNFILVALIEIPGYVATWFVVNRWGRRISLCASLLLAGVSCIGFVFVPAALNTGRLLLFMCGKFAITISFTTLYMYTTEMFPTSTRQSILGTCAMLGRVGSIIAPQTPLLNQYMDSLPLLLFGVMSLIASSLSLLFPETLNARLPDTVLEAEFIQQEKLEPKPVVITLAHSMAD